MKTGIVAFICLLFGHPLLFSQDNWTEEDRSQLIKLLSETQADLMDEVQGLSAEQWIYQPEEDSWSIAQVVEHLGVYEEYLYWDLFYGQYTPVREDLAVNRRRFDQEYLDYATDQTKGQSPWLAVPIGRFDNPEDLIHFFNRFREEIIAFLTETDADLRRHFTYRAPGSEVWSARDLHQHTLIWIAHTARHTEQIRRIKESAGFPTE